MLTTLARHNRRLRAGAVLTAFGLGLPVGMAPALAETLAGQAQVSVEASATPDATTADSDDEAGLTGAADVQADVSVNGYLIGLLDGSGDGPDWSGIAGTSILTDGSLTGGGLPNLVPELGLPNLGVPGLGLPGLGLPSLPDRLPSIVLPSVLNSAPTGQSDDPAMVNASHVGPVGGLVIGSAANPGGGPASGSSAGPSQSIGGSPSSLPRTGANLRLRAVAAFGLLGLAGLGSRRRRSA